MDLGKAGWLNALLEAATRDFRPSQASEAELKLRPRARARAVVRRVLRQSGLLYGTPAQPEPAEAARGVAREEVLFVAVMRTLARLALDVASLIAAPDGPRREQLLVLFAMLAGEVKEAARIHAALPKTLPSKRTWSKIESSLAQRAMSLSGDPAYGLVLHNGAIYVDAKTFVRQAIDYFSSGTVRPELAERRLAFAAQHKALLVEVLTALACAERKPSLPARRAILRQIEDLHLPSALEGNVRARVKRWFERRPALRDVVAGVRGRETRRFLIEQTLLASLVDGRRSPREMAFIGELARALGVSPEEQATIEVGVAEFYAKNRSVVDVFTLAPGAEVMGEEVVDEIQRTVEKNFHRLMREVKETGELSLLLARAARGAKLSDDEKHKMRAQLLDVAKAIPALAIFAAPGGLLLLIALAKVLPFDILPSAFRDEPDVEPRPTQKPQRGAL